MRTQIKTHAKFIRVFIVFLALFLVGWIIAQGRTPTVGSLEVPINLAQEVSMMPQTAVVYRSQKCGCCGQYLSYLESSGLKIETRWVDETDDRAAQFGIPVELASCHTMVIGDYLVEGHVPVEAIQKLFLDSSALVGISLPGMPAGSPGMAGLKSEPFEIKGFATDGTMTDFLSI